MEHKTLNASHAEMVLVRKSDVDFLINYINEVLVQIEEFVSDEANKDNKKECDLLRRKLCQCNAYVSALRVLQIISAEQVADYEEKNTKYRITLTEWFYKRVIKGKEYTNKNQAQSIY